MSDGNGRRQTSRWLDGAGRKGGGGGADWRTATSSYKYKHHCDSGLWIVYFRTSRSLRAPPSCVIGRLHFFLNVFQDSTAFWPGDANPWGCLRKLGFRLFHIGYRTSDPPIHGPKPYNLNNSHVFWDKANKLLDSRQAILNKITLIQADIYNILNSTDQNHICMHNGVEKNKTNMPLFQRRNKNRSCWPTE